MTEAATKPASGTRGARFGIVNVHKPAGITSRDAVNHLQRLVRPAKIGHAGTLDPLATGVLVVCIGPATRLIEYVQQQPKRYRGTFLLGRTSPTEDVDGEVELLVDPPIPGRDQLAAAAAAYVGDSEQRPPAYSALKVAGQRAYKLARAGVAVELAPRPIRIYRLDVLDYSYPQFTLDIECSAGTYVRSLGRDLAEGLGTGAVMSALARTGIGRFTLEDAVPLDAISAATLPGLLRNPLEAVAHLPRVEVSAAEIAELFHGRALQRGAPSAVAGPESAPDSIATEWAAVDAAGQLVALLQPGPAGTLRPSRCFKPGD